MTCTLKRLDGTEIGTGATLRVTAEANRADLWRADLRGADLRGADLRHATLWGADLRGADLRGADLRGASLWDTDLRGANLRDANLRDANLGDANLRDANLGDANLGDADLRGASCLLALDSRGYFATLTWDMGAPSDVVIRFGCRRWTSMRAALAHYGPDYDSDGDRSECCTILRHLATLYRLRTGINLEEM